MSSARPTVGLDIRPPVSRDDLLAELRRVGTDGAAFWDTFPEEEFQAPLGSAWSPADTVRHLVKSARPVALALRLPRGLLRLAFGRARRPSRPFERLREDYRSKLAAGAGAGPFAPFGRSPLRAPATWRRRLMSRRAAVWSDLVAQAERWSEADLDRCRLPHPLLGRLTVREMLLFTLYHEVHHAAGVARRAAEPRGPGVGG